MTEIQAKVDQARREWANVFWGAATAEERRAAWQALEAAKAEEATMLIAQAAAEAQEDAAEAAAS